MNAATNNGHSLIEQLMAGVAAADNVSAADTVDAALAADYSDYCAAIVAYNATIKRCSRCGGYGYLNEYSHINGGKCFRCDGHIHTADTPVTVEAFEGEIRRSFLARRAADAGFGDFDVVVG